MAICLGVWLGAGLEDVWAQDKPKEPPKLGWSNSTDLSLVLTAGNSAAQTWGFSDELKHVWKDARFKFETNIVRSDTSDDRFFQVAPGIEFPVGGAPVNPTTSLVIPDPTLDVATYLLRGSYERNITPKFFWNAGARLLPDTPGALPPARSARVGTTSTKWHESWRKRPLSLMPAGQ